MTQKIIRMKNNMKTKWLKPRIELLSNSINSGELPKANVEMMGVCYVNVDTSAPYAGTCLVSFVATYENILTIGPTMVCVSTLILDSSAFACS